MQLAHQRNQVEVGGVSDTPFLATVEACSDSFLFCIGPGAPFGSLLTWRASFPSQDPSSPDRLLLAASGPPTGRGASRIRTFFAP
jgi:hypothetical protein